jgi:hypothetical protein
VRDTQKVPYLCTVRLKIGSYVLNGAAQMMSPSNNHVMKAVGLHLVLTFFNLLNFFAFVFIFLNGSFDLIAYLEPSNK